MVRSLLPGILKSLCGSVTQDKRTDPVPIVHRLRPKPRETEIAGFTPTNRAPTMAAMSSCPTNIRELDTLITKPTDQVLQAVAECSGSFAVLGAGGKMGFHLSLMLQNGLRQLGRTDSVTTVSRFGDDRTRQQFIDAGFNVVAADLSDVDAVRALPAWDNVFFMAGVKFGTTGQPDLLHRMNVVMPQLVADHFRESRIVALSTGCVYSFSTPESGGSTEDDETNPPGEYAQSCLGRELAFQSASELHGTRTSLIRLNYSIDLRYGVLLDIAQKVRHGQPVDVDTGHVNVIWQGDAIAHTIQSLPHAANPPFTINVTGAETLRVKDIAHQFGQRFGVKVSFTGSEQPLAWLSNAKRSHALFGRPTVSVDQMIDWIATWLNRGGETLNKPADFQTRDGRY